MMRINSSPHRHSAASVTRVMLTVVAALLPCLLVATLVYGTGILFNVLLSILAAVLFEVLLLILRGRRPWTSLRDGSAVVTGLLFGLMLSPLAPWWICVIGAGIAMTVGKHLYGGLGQNLFNPAITGYVFVLLSFPVAMQAWPPPSSMFIPTTVQADHPDALSGATALTHMQGRLAAREMISEFRNDPVYGHIGGRGQEWINVAYLAGGILLLGLGVTGARIPLAVIGGLGSAALLAWMMDPNLHPSPLFHLFSGGTMLCAFFIATDPVTSPSTPRGKLIYGLVIGVVAWVIRDTGHYADGLAFAVLLGNALTALLDRHTRPPVVGELR